MTSLPPFALFFVYPQPNSGGWWNSTPENLAGQVGPVALAGPNGEPSGFGRGVFVGGGGRLIMTITFTRSRSVISRPKRITDNDEESQLEPMRVTR